MVGSLGFLEMLIKGDVPFDGSCKVKVVTSRDGHVKDRGKIGQKLGVDIV